MWDVSGSFDCGGKSAAFAQDDSFSGMAIKEQTTAKANTGVLRCAQDDKFWWGCGREHAHPI